MEKLLRKRIIVLAPIIVLFATVYFMLYTVQLFKDTNYNFVYETNVASVQRFVRSLAELSSQGYGSQGYGPLYTRLIRNYNKTTGEKNAVITFMLDEDGQIHHSTPENQAYVEAALNNESNMEKVSAAAASGADNGEIVLENASDTSAKETKVYFTRLYVDEFDYYMFMCVRRQDIESRLSLNGIVIPISVVGLLMFLTLEHSIWLNMALGDCKDKIEMRDDDAT